MEEVWKDVVGREGCYQVSNLGRVRSLDRIVPMIGSKVGKRLKGCDMKLRKDKDGYNIVDLKLNGKSHLRKVHRLVAEAFIPNINGYKNIDHVNSIRNDNRVENLRWCTTKQNANFELARINRSRSIKESYNRCAGLREIRAKHFRECSRKPLDVYINGVFVKHFGAIIDAVREYNIPQSQYRKLRNGDYNYNGITFKVYE